MTPPLTLWTAQSVTKNTHLTQIFTMNLSRLTFPAASLLALASSPALAQNTIVSTRTLAAETFDLTADFESGGGMFSFQNGIVDIDTDHGVPTLVEIDLSVVFDIDLSITNLSGGGTSFYYNTPVDLASVPRDCAAYDYDNLNGFIGSVPNGAVGNLVVNDTLTFGFNGTSFNTACGSPWSSSWNSAFLWTSILDNTPRLGWGSGIATPSTWIQVNTARAIVTGEVRITWAPDPIPSQTICSGSAAPPILLEAAGGFGAQPDVYFFQTGAPDSTNLLVQGSQATSIVPATGICLQGTIRRIPGSLQQGGQPVRLPSTSALSGSTTYFQSWFRTTGQGASATSPCIGVTFP